MLTVIFALKCSAEYEQMIYLKSFNVLHFATWRNADGYHKVQLIKSADNLFWCLFMIAAQGLM